MPGSSETWPLTRVFSRRRSVSTALRSAKAAAVRHSPRWPGIRPQYSLARGIHLLHRSPVGWPLADMVFTHLRQSEPVGCANILRARLLSWAMLGSNQRPPRCQRGALPLRQSPSRRRRESNPRTGLCRPLPKPLGHSASANVPLGESWLWTSEVPCGPGACGTESGASERTTGFEPATLTLAR